MEIKNQKGTSLNSMEAWKSGFLEIDNKVKHWKEQRSAESLAWFFLNGNGEQYLEGLFSHVFHTLEVAFSSGIIEWESKFDRYLNGRKQDLAIDGTINDQSIFVAIEAKVDEEFGKDIATAEQNAQNLLAKTPTSNALTRIEELKQRFKIPNESLPYQLLHYLAGTVGDGKRKGVKCVLMPVLVFETKEYNKNPLAELI